MLLLGINLRSIPSGIEQPDKHTNKHALINAMILLPFFLFILNFIKALVILLCKFNETSKLSKQSVLKM